MPIVTQDLPRPNLPPHTHSQIKQISSLVHFPSIRSRAVRGPLECGLKLCGQYDCLELFVPTMGGNACLPKDTEWHLSSLAEGGLTSCRQPWLLRKMYTAIYWA